MKYVRVQATAEVVISKVFKVSDEYEIRGSTPHEVYDELHQQFGDPDEPNLTVGDIDLYDYGVSFGQFMGFEQVTVTNEENPREPVRVIEEPYPVLTKSEEVRKYLSNFFGVIDKEGFEIVYGLIFTDEEWNEFLDHMRENGRNSLDKWLNEDIENWHFSRRNGENLNQAA